MTRLSHKLLAVLGTDVGVVLRYLITSAINVVNHQLLLQMALRWWGWSGGVANAFAAMIAVIPAYLLSRYWVWEVSGPNSVRREVGPFWIIAVLGLVLSTAAAETADRLFGSDLLVSAGSLAGYFVVWLGKFVMLNVVFRQPDEEPGRTAVRTGRR
ncbi:MAG: GtrA family protein [Actinomycetota bacterium]